MTKTLTEQWREGTLPEDCYYILTKNGHIRKERTCFYSHTDEQCFCFTSNKDIEEVLSLVPDYDEYIKPIKKAEQLEKKIEIATKALKDCCNDMKYWAVLTHRNQRILGVIKQALKEMEGVK